MTEEQKDVTQRIEEASFDDLLKLCKEDLDSANKESETKIGRAHV